MNYQQKALEMHAQWKGKIEIASRAPLACKDDLSVAYTPGVAEPCREIAKNKDLVYSYTRKWNLVAIVTDGSAVLGLGNIGPEAGMPVMEGKAVLFKEFAGVDAFPICLATQNVDEIVDAVAAIAPTFGGINLEDISGPRCFDIEARLIERLDIPVFHDDQHGTAVVVLAALLNALKITGEKMGNLRVVVNGSGAAGIAITRLMQPLGVGDVVMLDTKGIIARSRTDLTPVKRQVAEHTNADNLAGDLKTALKGAHVFVGVSAANLVSRDMVKSMAGCRYVFALANPDPEILPDEAKAAGARIVATGRSDFANQVNNVLGFPGIFRGALDVRARRIDDAMKLAAARALADAVPADKLNEDFILPSPLDKSVPPKVAAAVANTARERGLARSIACNGNAGN